MEEIMAIRITTWIAALTVIAMPAMSGRVAAHQQKSTQYPYVLVDLGTFGGPQSSVTAPAQVLNNKGMVGGGADTSIDDPSYPHGNPGLQNYPDPSRFIEHAFLWRKGQRIDLGALPGMNSSYANWVNGRGEAVGLSGDGTMDTMNGYPGETAVLWKDGQIVNLGTLGGQESAAFAINNADQIIGVSDNTTPDKYSIFGLKTQTRAFLWQGAVMRDLGTLGGPDSLAQAINDKGQISGFSYIDATPVKATGAPTQHLFLWEHGQMRDLGTLGGAQANVSSMNNRGEVVGNTNLQGDKTYHPFLWNGKALIDLGTLGGANGGAEWINAAGDVVGAANLSTPCPGCGQPQVYHAFLWRNGVMTDLGHVPGDRCSWGYGINAAGQVVGASGHCHGGVHAFLWRNGSIVDLNSLAAPSALRMNYAYSINDRGEIAGTGVLANGSLHAFLLIPSGLAAGEGITTAR
jgi:probable HAF family extracellular repeat protein